MLSVTVTLGSVTGLTPNVGSNLRIWGSVHWNLSVPEYVSLSKLIITDKNTKECWQKRRDKGEEEEQLRDDTPHVFVRWIHHTNTRHTTTRETHVCSSLVPLTIPSTKFNTRVVFWSSVERDSAHTCECTCLVILVTKCDRWESTSQWASNVWELLSECTYVYSWYECHVFTIEE
jgi:hypothetical protein